MARHFNHKDNRLVNSSYKSNSSNESPLSASAERVYIGPGPNQYLSREKHGAILKAYQIKKPAAKSHSKEPREYLTGMTPNVKLMTRLMSDKRQHRGKYKSGETDIMDS